MVQLRRLSEILFYSLVHVDRSNDYCTSLLIEIYWPYASEFILNSFSQMLTQKRRSYDDVTKTLSQLFSFFLLFHYS